MPHLAPLSWSMSMVFFWVLLVGLCSLVWWMKGVEVKVDAGNVEKEGGESVKMGVWKW